MKTRNIITIALIALLTAYSGFAQFSADVDGTLDVSPVNGNLNYNYPISNNTIDGFNLKVDLVYTSNTSYSVLGGYFADKDSADGWSKFHYTHPTWLIGVNGFAVNVLTYKSCFMSQKVKYPNIPNGELGMDSPFDEYKQDYPFDPDELDAAIPLIEGYDYCNRMYRINRDDDQDIIRILRSDGGILELRNPVQRKNAESENDESLYTGLYYENTSNPEGFAKVEFDTVTYWPDYIKVEYNSVANRNSYKPRKLKYYKGDGLEYVFREVTVPYGVRAHKMVLSRVLYEYDTSAHKEFPVTSEFVVPGSVTPTIFYLEEINSDLRNIATFKREWHNFESDKVNITRGRAFITEFANHKITLGTSDMKIEALDRTISCSLKDQWQIEKYGYTFRRNIISFDNKDEEIRSFYKRSVFDSGWVDYIISEIADPQYRKTKFEYDEFGTNGANKYGYGGLQKPFINFSVFKPRMKSITEPTKAYDITYSPGTSVNFTDKNSLINNDYTLNGALLSMVSDVKKYEYINNSKGSHLQTILYEIHQHTDSPRITNVYLKDEILNQIDTTDYKFDIFVLNPFRSNADEPYLSQTQEFLLPVLTKTYYPDRIVIEELSYTQHCNLGGNSSYYWLPDSTVTKIYNYKDVIVKSKIHNNYEFTTINNFGGNTELNNQFAEVISKATQRMQNPVTGETLLKRETEYKHFELTTVGNQRIDTLFDKVSSFAATDYARKYNDELKTIIEFESKQFNDWNLCPLLYLPKREVVKDANDTILSGKSYYYNSSFDVLNTRYRRGVLLADSVISKYGEKTLLNATYEYTGGRKQNLMTASKNSIGARKRMYYRYSDVAALDGAYPTGKKLYDTDLTDDITLYNEMYEFETPVALEEYIRKWNPASNTYYLDTLRTYSEKTYYGQTSGAVDANGWYAKNEYDKNGRALYTWLPFDFPLCDRPEGEITTTKHILEFGVSDEVIRQKIVGAGLISNVKHTLDTHYDSSYVEPPDQAMVGPCYGSLFGMWEETIGGDTTIRYQNTENYSVWMVYVARSNDALHSCTAADSAQLKFTYAGDYVNECMTVNVSTDKFGIDEDYVIGCPALQHLDNATAADPPTSTPELTVDLTPILDDMRAMNDGEKLSFRVRTSSLDGNLKIITNSEDQKPVIKVNKLCCDIHEDFTISYLYDDIARTVTTTTKIDDIGHTSSTGWQPTYAEKYGRYTSGKSYYGAENRLLKSELLIGSPASPIRTDAVTYTLSGGSLVTFVTDQLGFVTQTEYDHGKVKKAINADNTYKQFGNHIQIAPVKDTLDVWKSEFYPLYKVDPDSMYGHYEVYTSTDELGKTNLEFYNGLGQLVKKFIDYDTLKITTSFEYDLSGNLVKTTHDNGEVSTYVYDIFNRLRYKTNKDIDTVAYGYNNLGQVRFSQNKEQKNKNSVSFIEYDDLGRVVLSGEANIDPTGLDMRTSAKWLTDTLDPNVLNFEGYNAGTDYPTVNRTIWDQGSFIPQPVFWASQGLVEKTSLPFISDTLDILDPGPYLMHPADYYDYSETVAAPYNNFENMKYYTNFIKTACSYDALPQCTGPVWGAFPALSQWNSLVPVHPWDDGEAQTPRNLRGRKAAVAYRDDGNEPFHYVVTSYDPRGRVEALLRYTENLGYDAVYYTYDSHGQVICSRVVDPERQYVNWYSYDDNGRVDSIWTKLTAPGTGLGVSSMGVPVCPGKPVTADIVYRYDRRGSVETIRFQPAFTTQSFVYNPRGWVDSMMAKNDYNQVLFRQVFERDEGGNIEKQKSQHTGRDEMVQNYAYDGLYRLQKWSDGTDSVQYTYDRLGNRLTETKNLNINTIYHYESTEGAKNRLSEVYQGGDYRSYLYNSVGAVTKTSNSEMIEKFDYTSGGSLKHYTKIINNTPNYSCNGATMTRNEINKYDWYYRYSALGGREQKRLYYSPQGDSACGDDYNQHGWTYYLLGAAGEQLAVYKGVQVSHSFESGGLQRRVYMYNESYLSAGGLMVTLPNGTKQFNAMDNIGSVRLVVQDSSGVVTTKHFDYKPFGDTLNASGESRIGYASQERDEESRYFAMGARQYDPLTGRFLSVDPLYEQFPDKTPYHYCNNNPVSFKDPSGLSPENEKGREDEVQSCMSDAKLRLLQAWNESTMFAQEWTNTRVNDIYNSWAKHINDMTGLHNYYAAMNFGEGGGGGGGGSSSGSGARTGSQEGGSNTESNQSANTWSKSDGEKELVNSVGKNGVPYVFTIVNEQGVPICEVTIEKYYLDTDTDFHMTTLGIGVTVLNDEYGLIQWGQTVNTNEGDIRMLGDICGLGCFSEYIDNSILDNFNIGFPFYPNSETSCDNFAYYFYDSPGRTTESAYSVSWCGELSMFGWHNDNWEILCTFNWGFSLSTNLNLSRFNLKDDYLSPLVITPRQTDFHLDYYNFWINKKR